MRNKFSKASVFSILLISALLLTVGFLKLHTAQAACYDPDSTLANHACQPTYTEGEVKLSISSYPYVTVGQSTTVTWDASKLTDGIAGNTGGGGTGGGGGVIHAQSAAVILAQATPTPRAPKCYASGAWSGEKLMTGTVSTGSMNTPGQYTFEISCFKGVVATDGTVTNYTGYNSITLNVCPTNAPYDATTDSCNASLFNISTAGITQGGSATLTYPLNTRTIDMSSAPNVWQTLPTSITGPDVVQGQSVQTIGKTLTAGTDGTKYSYILTQQRYGPCALWIPGIDMDPVCLPSYLPLPILKFNTVSFLTVCPVSKPWDPVTKSCQPIKICSDTHYGCNGGATSANNVNGATAYTWDCQMAGAAPAMTGQTVQLSGSTCKTTSVACPYGSPDWDATPVNVTFYDSSLGAYSICPTHTTTCYSTPQATPVSTVASCTENKIANTPYGTLTTSITSCTIPNGGNSCSLDLAWTLQNPATTPTKITTSGSDYTVSTSLASPQNGTQTVTVPYTDPSVPTDRTFYLYNNGMELARKVLTATCAAGGIWDGTACAPSNSTSFHNIFQVAKSHSTNGFLDDKTLIPTTLPLIDLNGPIAAGVGSKFIQQGYTFPASGNWSVRACTDLPPYSQFPSGKVGYIVESNEGDNCAPWANVSVATKPIGADKWWISDFGANTPNPVVRAAGDTTFTQLHWTIHQDGGAPDSCVGTSNPSTSWVGNNKSINGAGTQTVNGLKPGTYTFTLKCTDATTEKTSTTSPINITIQGDGSSSDGQCGIPANHKTRQCSPDHGTYDASSLKSTASEWTWTCKGIGSGQDSALCHEPKKKPTYKEN